MYVVVKTENLEVGTVVAYDHIASIWRASQGGETIVGVITAIDEEASEYWAQVTFSGTAFALASRNIPDEGGALMVESGKVYVGTAPGCGIISPLPRGQESRLAGEFTMIHLR